MLSIEAMPTTYARLVKNVEANRSHQNVELYQGAAFDEDTTLEFMDYGVVASSLNSAFGSRGENSLINQENKVAVKAQPADAILAQYGLQHVDLIKIDAESSEKYVIRGLAKTLERSRPTIVMEVGDIGIDNGTPSAELIRLLSAAGYTAHKWEGLELIDFKTSGPLAYANLVFLPNDN